MLNSERLTTRQGQLLAFYQNRQRESGFVPTLQETANHFGFKSANSVRQHLRLIEKKGFVRRLPGRSRALLFTREQDSGDSNSVHVPLLGRIPAGALNLAQEEVEAFLTLPASLFRGSGLFALRVRGTSMLGAGILDGDIAVLDSKPEVANGAIAAIQLDDEATLKRVYKKGNELSLWAENPDFPEIRVGANDARRARILGPLVGIVRKV